MKFKQAFIPNMTAVALLIAGLSADLAHVSALEFLQAHPHELSEATNALQGLPSNMTVADVTKDINEGKLDCTAILPDGQSLIVYVFSLKDEDAVKACVNQCAILGECLGYVNDGCRTILHCAALSTPKPLKIVLDDLPLSYTMLNRIDSDRNTPIAVAAFGRRVENVQILKEAGADLTLKVSGEWTPLEWAKYYQRKGAKYHQPLNTDPERQKQEAVRQKKLDEIINILSRGATIKL